MSAVEVRALGAADHPAWYPLWRAYQVFYKSDIPESVSAVSFARMLDPAEPVHGALAWADGVAVGMAHWLTHRTTWTTGDHCYLNDLYVSEAVRRGGIGRQLIEHVYADAAQRGCSQVYWLTHETNATAQRLYNGVATRTGFIHYAHKLG